MFLYREGLLLKKNFKCLFLSSSSLSVPLLSNEGRSDSSVDLWVFLKKEGKEKKNTKTKAEATSNIAILWKVTMDNIMLFLINLPTFMEPKTAFDAEEKMQKDFLDRPRAKGIGRQSQEWKFQAA